MLQGRDYKDPPEFVKAQRRSLFAWSDSPVHAQSSSSRDFRSGPLGSSEAGSSGGGRRLQSGGVVEDARQPRTGAGSLAEGLGDSVATGTQRKSLQSADVREAPICMHGNGQMHAQEPQAAGDC